MQNVPDILIPFLLRSFNEDFALSQTEAIDESSSQINFHRLELSLKRGEAFRECVNKEKWIEPQLIKEFLVNRGPSYGNLYYNDTETLNNLGTISLWHIKSADAITQSALTKSTIADKIDFLENFVEIIDDILPIKAEHQKLVDDIASKYFAALEKKPFPSI